MTTYDTIRIDNLNIFYRETRETGLPHLVLLHGFPSSSHMFRDLIPMLEGDFHVIAPDYPGFGQSDMPDRTKCSYTFDRIADVMDKFLGAK